MGTNETYSTKTQNYHLVALRAFLSYLKLCGYNILLPSEVPLEIATTTKLNVTSENNFWKMYESIDGADGKILRDRAIVLMLGTTGVKVGELCMLNKNDLNNDEVFVQGKVNRSVLLSAGCVQVIDEYLNARRDSDEALFVNNGKRVSKNSSLRLTPRSVQRVVQH